MKQILFLFLSISLFITSCSQNPEELLNQAQSDILNYKTINYNVQAYYPNPAGKIDTIITSASFVQNNNSVMGYDFILMNEVYDNINIEGVFKSVNHRTKKVELFPNQELQKAKSYIERMNVIRYSPITLLKQTEWEFLKDSTMEDKQLKDYYKVVNDTIIDGNEIYTEEHIFINSNSKLLEQWERRNYFKGNLSQVIVYKYSDYKLDNADTPLSYVFPSEYPSILYGQEDSRIILKEGTKAPFFLSTDLQNKTLNLEDYRGKRILLNFSSIGCGNSHEALEYINQENIQISDNLSLFYLSIWDKKEDVVDYFNKVNTPFLVIPNAEKLADTYGVSSTPTFFLIDDKGIIEKVIIGNNKEFLENLKD